jgi:hypothetical protein
MPRMTARGFLRLVQRGGLRDPLAALFRRQGLNDKRGGADKPGFHRGRRLEGTEVIPERRVDATAKLTAGLGEDKGGWRRIDRGVSQATGIHDRKIGAHAMAEIFIGGPQFMLKHLQGSQDAEGHGLSATLGFFGKPFVETLFAGAHQSYPGEGISPLAERMARGHKVGDLQRCSCTAQPMLKLANTSHRGGS